MAGEVKRGCGGGQHCGTCIITQGRGTQSKPGLHSEILIGGKACFSLV